MNLAERIIATAAEDIIAQRVGKAVRGMRRDQRNDREALALRIGKVEDKVNNLEKNIADLRRELVEAARPAAEEFAAWQRSIEQRLTRIEEGYGVLITDDTTTRD